jgi:hypothetical protein
MEKRIKKTFATASVQDFNINVELISLHTPKAGDVGIFRLILPHGNYIMGTDGATTAVFEGDFVMAAFGARYATNQYEAYVPESPVTKCQLVGRGGVAGLVASANPTFRNPAAEMELVGYATDAAGQVINTIREDLLRSFTPSGIRAKVILSIGSSMDSGKTTTAANLCAGLVNQGHKAAFIKLTGTAFPKDVRNVYDRGAVYACDFSHFGYPSTFLFPKNTLLDIYQSLHDVVMEQCDAEYIVVEIADGILQRETAMLLRDRRFMDTIHAVVMSCGDSLGVLSGLNILEEFGIRPIALSGLFTASELLIREVEPFIDTPVLRARQLVEGSEIVNLLAAKALGFRQKYAYAA